MSPTSFRAEYRRSSGPSVFSRSVRLQVDVAPVNKEDGEDTMQLHCLTFTLLSGIHIYLAMHMHVAYIHCESRIFIVNLLKSD